MVEDAEKQFLEEEDANKEEEPKEENTCAIMSIKEVSRAYDSLIFELPHLFYASELALPSTDMT